MAFDVVHVLDPVEPTEKFDGLMWVNPEELEGDVSVTRVWDADNGVWLKIAGVGPIGPQGIPGTPGADGADGVDGSAVVHGHTGTGSGGVLTTYASDTELASAIQAALDAPMASTYADTAQDTSLPDLNSTQQDLETLNLDFPADTGVFEVWTTAAFTLGNFVSGTPTVLTVRVKHHATAFDTMLYTAETWNAPPGHMIHFHSRLAKESNVGAFQLSMELDQGVMEVDHVLFQAVGKRVT